MPKTDYIELGDGSRIDILYEDRAVLALDKPPGWMLVPFNWQRTSRNLQAAFESSIRAGSFWARSRNLRFLRHVHRLDAETSGILLCAKSRGGLDKLAEMFETRSVSKVYLAVVEGEPAEKEWSCFLSLAPDPQRHGRMIVDRRTGKQAETRFRAIVSRPVPGPRTLTLVEARPVTGRTHQIRVHLTAAHLPILGDDLYGTRAEPASSPESRRPSARRAKTAQAVPFPLGLRAVCLGYADPFTGKPVRIGAPVASFLTAFGFPSDVWAPPEGLIARGAGRSPAS